MSDLSRVVVCCGAARAWRLCGFGILPNKFLATQGAVYVQGHCLQEQRIVYTSALLATIVLVLKGSQPVSYTDAQT